MVAASLIDRLFLSLVRALSGTQAAEHLRTTADWLYPVGGRRNPAYKRWRYLLRSLMFLRATTDWLRFLFARPKLRAVLRHQPALAEKVHRPYLRKELSAAGRVAALTAHYGICLAHPSRDLLLTAAERETEIARFAGKDGEAFQITLGPPGTLQKEGELALKLIMSGKTLYRLAFSFLRADYGPAVFIGCLQGAPGSQETGERMRTATKALHGRRPRDMMIDTLQALAQALGASHVVACGRDQHIYRHRRKQRDFSQDYDKVWEEVGGARLSDGSYELPLVPVQRPLSEYPSKKRAAMARRHALERDVAAGICQRVLAIAA